MSENETLEEIRQLSNQLQRLYERAPPRGVALATISALLETCRTSHPLTLKPPIVTKLNDSHITHSDKSTNTDTNISQLQHTTSNGCAKITITDESGKSLNRQSSIIDKNLIDAGGGNCVTFCDDLINKTSDESSNQSTSNINYENLKLQCMCSSFDQSFDEYTDVRNCNCSKTKSLDLKCLKCNMICKQSNMKCCHNDNNVNNSNLCDKIVKRLSDKNLVELSNEQSSKLHVHNTNDENYVLDSLKNMIKINPLTISKSDDLRLIKSSHNNLPVDECSLSHNLINEISTTPQVEISLNLGNKLEAPTNTEVSGLMLEGTGANLNKKKQLVLDLNDRSKYTKEVSV